MCSADDTLDVCVMGETREGLKAEKRFTPVGV